MNFCVLTRCRLPMNKFLSCTSGRNCLNVKICPWSRKHSTTEKFLSKALPISSSLEDPKKKRPPRIKRTNDITQLKPGHWKTVAYATADAYNMRELQTALSEQNLYIPSELTSNDTLETASPGVLCGSALHTVAKYQVTPEARHMYYFEEGMVVMWNVTEAEEHAILEFLKPFEIDSYKASYVRDEIETMTYTYNNQSKRTYINNGIMYIGTMERSIEDIAADRYTLSNAMSLSVKLGVLEALLNDYIDDIEYLTEDLKSGVPLRVNQRELLKKSGELYALKHSINLSTDLLDIPDFYWEQERLENLYKKTCYYFSIPKRTTVINEKLNNCVELIQLVSSHLSDRHHVRLEWMIIALICVEVIFEVLHFFHL